MTDDRPAEQYPGQDEVYRRMYQFGRSRADWLLDRQMERTGARETTATDPYADMTTGYAREVLRLMDAALEAEGIDPDAARRVLERVVFGVVPSPAEVAYRQQTEKRLLDLATRFGVLIPMTEGDNR